MHRINIKRALAALVCAALLAGCAGGPAQSESAPREDFTSLPAQGAASGVPQAAGGLSYKAVWVSYLEWANLDTSSEAAFTAAAATLLDNCRALGLNTVIVQVRPFGDAVYPSALFPWSHLVTGVQGQAPDYDPLAVFLRETHARGMAFEAWVNPYRIALTDAIPGQLAEDSLANLHPEWVKEANGGLYLDPASAEVQDYIVRGLEELLDGYDVDGIQFDDYFYPTTEAAFDADAYAAAGGGLSLEEWRRQNVNTLVQKAYGAVKAKKPHVVFGISPQGNNDNNYNGQYSDVGLWLSTPGYVDYIMPQVYWGWNFTLQSGSDRFAFGNIVDEWLAMPRDPAVHLAFGLGAFRVGAGDGSAASSEEWLSGHNLADMVASLREKGADGYALYRYDSLYRAGEFQSIADAEAAALTAENQK